MITNIKNLHQSDEDRKFIRTIQQKAHLILKKHLNKGDSVLATCSGGKDSLALLHILHTSPLNLRVHMLTIDHGLRDVSYEQSKYVYSMANKLGIESAFVTLSLKKDDENTARRERHFKFRAYQAMFNCDWIATGHTMSDQVETIMMRFIRGTGIKGLRGIQESFNGYIRPLLGLTAEETEKYVNAIGWTIQHDESNDSDKYFRNRVRHNVIPFLMSENPSLGTSIYNLTKTAQEESEALSFFVQREYDERVKDEHHRLNLSLTGISKLPKAVVKKLLVQFWDSSYKFHNAGRCPSEDGYQLSNKKLEQAYNVVVSNKGGQIVQFPGVSFLKLKGCFISEE